MCGRFGLTLGQRELAREFFDLNPEISFPDIAPRYNIAPRQPVLVLHNSLPLAELVHWGLTPPWSQGRDLINVRSESALRPGWMSHLLERARVLLPASHFYEWQSGPAGRRPLLIAARDGGLLVFAGLLGRWTDRRTGDQRPAVAILTTEPNAVMGPIHRRMPVVLPRSAWGAWLDPGTASTEIAALMRPCPDPWLVVRPASPLVNDPRNEGPELVRGLADAGPAEAGRLPGL